MRLLVGLEIKHLKYLLKGWVEGGVGERLRRPPTPAPRLLRRYHLELDRR
jgi:hypothetical protein